MWALIESNNITKIYSNPKGMTIGDIQYPSNIHNLWSTAEKEAIGIYEIVEDNTNKKNKEYYTNTNQSYTFSDGVVTAAYGTATAKAIADVDEVWTQAEIDAEADGSSGKSANDPKLDSNGNQVVTKGLKSIKKIFINNEAKSLLSEYDWYVIRKEETGTAIPDAISTYRTNVRSTSNSMQTKIDNAANVDALAALFVYTGDPATRPLGEWPSRP